MTTVDPSGSGYSASQVSRNGLNQNFDQFLNLLTTQLQNQDPLQPMDTNEFTNQLVQFSTVEQQIKTNENLESLILMQNLNLTALGLSFIGKSVEIEGDTFQTEGGRDVQLSYELPADATSGTITILDENGETVYTQTAETTAGVHSFTWNGKTNDGFDVPPGKYEIRVGALTETGTSLNITTYVPGHVSGLESAPDGTLLLNIGEEKIPMTSVRKIFEST